MCWDCFCIGFDQLRVHLTSSYFEIDYPAFQQRFKLDFFHTTMDNFWLERPLQLRNIVQATKGHLELEELILITNPQLVSNPRDKIYGLLGLGPREATFHILVDCSADVQSVFATFVQYSFGQSGNLNILSWCASLREWDDEQPWPSWLPRLDRRLVHAPSAPLPLVGITYRRAAIYCASGCLSNEFQLAQGQRLGVWAFPVDEVELTDNAFRAQPAGRNRQPDSEAFANVFSRVAQSCGICFGCQPQTTRVDESQEKTGKQTIKPNFEHKTESSTIATCSNPNYSPRMPREPLLRLPCADM